VSKVLPFRQSSIELEPLTWEEALSLPAERRQAVILAGPWSASNPDNEPPPVVAMGGRRGRSWETAA
jgi:hypothetical protein